MSENVFSASVWKWNHTEKQCLMIKTDVGLLFWYVLFSFIDVLLFNSSGVLVKELNTQRSALASVLICVHFF